MFNWHRFLSEDYCFYFSRRSLFQILVCLSLHWCLYRLSVLEIFKHRSNLEDKIDIKFLSYGV